MLRRMTMGSLVLVGLLTGCGGKDELAPDSGTVTPDAPVTNTACDPYVPRAQAPTLLIGPLGWESVLLQKIADAKQSVDVMIYEFTRPSFIDAIIAAHRRGIAVRVIMDPDLEKNATTRTTLQTAGVPLKNGPATFDYYHTKAIIFDRTEAVLMSANLVWAHFEITRNYGVVDTDPEDVADVLSIVDADWAGSSPDLACTRLVVSPVNSRARLMDLIGRATTSLRIAAMYVKDEQIRAAIKARKDAGVDVRVLVPDPAWIPDSVMDAQWFAAQSIPVKYFKRYDLHAKLIISDDVAFIGSENFSWTSLNKNREVGVFVTEPVPLTAAKDQFEADWTVGVVGP